jgi:hypothetical protein
LEIVTLCADTAEENVMLGTAVADSFQSSKETSLDISSPTIIIKVWPF